MNFFSELILKLGYYLETFSLIIDVLQKHEYPFTPEPLQLFLKPIDNLQFYEKYQHNNGEIFYFIKYFLGATNFDKLKYSFLFRILYQLIACKKLIHEMVMHDFHESYCEHILSISSLAESIDKSISLRLRVEQLNKTEKNITTVMAAIKEFHILLGKLHSQEKGTMHAENINSIKTIIIFILIDIAFLANNLLSINKESALQLLENREVKNENIINNDHPIFKKIYDSFAVTDIDTALKINKQQMQTFRDDITRSQVELGVIIHKFDGEVIQWFEDIHCPMSIFTGGHCWGLAINWMYLCLYDNSYLAFRQKCKLSKVFFERKESESIGYVPHFTTFMFQMHAARLNEYLNTVGEYALSDINDWSNALFNTLQSFCIQDKHPKKFIHLYLKSNRKDSVIVQHVIGIACLQLPNKRNAFRLIDSQNGEFNFYNLKEFVNFVKAYLSWKAYDNYYNECEIKYFDNMDSVAAAILSCNKNTENSYEAMVKYWGYHSVFKYKCKAYIQNADKTLPEPLEDLTAVYNAKYKKEGLFDVKPVIRFWQQNIDVLTRLEDKKKLSVLPPNKVTPASSLHFTLSN